jgi:hypothetical protein
MLDDKTEIPVARFALVDYLMFSYDVVQLVFNWTLMRRILREKSPSWHLRYVYLQSHQIRALEVRDMCYTVGIHFIDEIALDPEDATAVFDLKANCDFAFVPTLKTLPVNFYLQQPPDAKTAVEIICWFSKCMEPFTYENYYKLINHYGV